MPDRRSRRLKTAWHGAAQLGIRPVTASLATSLFLVLLDNDSFWATVLNSFPLSSSGHLVFLAAVFLLLVSALTLLLSLFCFRYVFKPMVIAILLTASIAGYFMDAFGVMLDNTMIQGILETDSHEVLELVNLSLFFHVGLFGIIPSLIIGRLRIRYLPFRRAALANGGLALACIVLVLTNAVLFRRNYTSLIRENPFIRHLINPTNYIYASFHNIRRLFGSKGGPIVALGEDAHRSATRAPGSKKTLLILVVGETARAKDFSLDGYRRTTNPLLSKERLTSFTQVHACGTATAKSLPCLFSPDGRASFNQSRARRSENLLDVLSHAGIQVLWRENNTGCKGLCDRVDTDEMAGLQIPGDCNASECYDTVLLHDLQPYVEQIESDAVIILHQKGSHGPAYFLRHPEEFTVFEPECTTNRLQDCSREELVNAYDNTILFTDYFLERVIDFLRENSDEFDTAMLYVSDHGESLGEHEVYLHGLPYFIAPDEQTHIPMILWLSDEFEQRAGIDTACMEARANEEYSHDNIFSSVLGLMDVETDRYDRGLDLTAGCRTAEGPINRQPPPATHGDAVNPAHQG